MITQFKNQFLAISTLLNASFTTKKVSELEDFVQGYNFAMPLINWIPLTNYNPTLSQSDSIIQQGSCVLEFINKAVTNDNYEDTKDLIIDDLITLSSNFLRKLNQNENGVFIGPTFSGSSQIDREYLANYCVAVRLTISFTTSINYNFNDITCTWMLNTGSWSDTGIWIDTSAWNDG